MSRHTHKLFDDFQNLNSQGKVNSEFLADEGYCTNRSLLKVTPLDKRRYKPDCVEYLKNNFTFTPKINSESKRMAEKSKERLLYNTKPVPKDIHSGQPPKESDNQDIRDVLKQDMTKK